MSALHHRLFLFAHHVMCRVWTYRRLLIFSFLLCLLAGRLTAASHAASFNPDFTPFQTTLPNDKLDFTNDRLNSCCTADYTEDGRPKAFPSALNPAPAGRSVPREKTFEQNNPKYIENSTPSALVACDRFADYPALTDAPPITQLPALSLLSFSTNVSIRPGALYQTASTATHTSDFHIEAAGGWAHILLGDVTNYSLCVAGGSNTVEIGNSDHGSIMGYLGRDTIRLTGDSTDMFVRTGAGADQLEVALTRSGQGGATFANHLYKTALSGGGDLDTLTITHVPFGAKWCHIGEYTRYGEVFEVVEFALPPSVISGPQRQRLDIGRSIETVEIKGKRYSLQHFLTHDVPE